MSIKLPTTYPPELPAGIAYRIASGSKIEKFHNGILLGASLNQGIKDSIAARRNTLDIGSECDDTGFFLLDCEPKPPSLIFSCFKETMESELEASAIALHTFKYLQISNIIIIDSASTFENSNELLFRVDDHINLTNVNPLDYWMMSNEPDPFFIDIRNLYKSLNNQALQDLKGIIHLAISDKTDPNLLEKSQNFAQTHGRAFVPESILSYYLGMSVSAIAINSANLGDNADSVSESILTILRDG